MEGLEAAEVSFKKIDLGDRFDAEYFHKDSLEIQELLIKRGAVPFTQFGDFVASAFYPAATELYQFGDIPFLRCVDCISYPIITSLQQRLFEKLPEYFIKEQKGISTLSTGEMVITKVGSPCFASLVEDYEYVGLSRTVLGLKNIRNIDSYYLLVFLRSKYGFGQLLRQRELTIQYQLTLDRVKAILIYNANSFFQEVIHNLVELHKSINNAFVSIYTNTTKMLLAQINLTNWKPPADSISIKSFAKSFLKTGRFDSEYYQPKYDELLNILSNYHTDILDNLVTIKKSIEPGSDAYLQEGIPFLRVADLSKYGLSQPEIFLDPSIYDVEGLMPRKDTILLSKDGSVGIAYKIEEDTKAITSGAILHLTVKDDRVLPDYLCLVLNSIVVQFQAERDAGGSIIQHWKPDEIKQVVIPILPKPIQEELVATAQESFQLQKQSKKLMEAAKQAVELAIERNEETAINWLRENKLIE